MLSVNCLYQRKVGMCKREVREAHEKFTNLILDSPVVGNNEQGVAATQGLREFQGDKFGGVGADIDHWMVETCREPSCRSIAHS